MKVHGIAEKQLSMADVVIPIKKSLKVTIIRIYTVLWHITCLHKDSEGIMMVGHSVS